MNDEQWFKVFVAALTGTSVGLFAVSSLLFPAQWAYTVGIVGQTINDTISEFLRLFTTPRAIPPQVWDMAFGVVFIPALILAMLAASLIFVSVVEWIDNWSVRRKKR